ncbi:MAG: response regulator [Alphaproteobacteria bacterium]|nr:response regulator [Alphaproteobacteria bacterium]
MKRILVIDDDAGVRDTVREMLLREGYDVDVAENGSIGLKKHSAAPYDLVITDIMMPVKEGIETIIALKDIDITLKIIAMSGGGNSGSLDYLKMSPVFGADGTLPKPFSKDELITTVTALLHDR